MNIVGDIQYVAIIVIIIVLSHFYIGKENK